MMDDEWRAMNDHGSRFDFQLLELPLRFDQDRKIRIGVIPQSEEILVRESAPGRVASQREGARQSEARQRPQRRSRVPAAMINYLLEFNHRFGPRLSMQVRLAAKVRRPEEGRLFVSAGQLQ